MSHLHFGNTPVPYTVSWSAEESFILSRCQYFDDIAIFQPVQIGDGKPMFGKPHMQRQREAIARDLCDLCGKSIRLSTKVSLSHARVQPHGFQGPCVMQVEPMLHKRCAAESMRWCPSLRRDIAAGTLFVRQVTRHRAQCAIMSAEYIGTITGQAVKALGHGKVELINWIDRDAQWLGVDLPERRAA